MAKQYLDDSGNPIAQPSGGEAPPSRVGSFLAPANEKANPTEYDPNTLRGYGARVGQALKGAGASVAGMFDPKSIPGTKENPINWNPLTQLNKDVQGVKDWNELRKVNPDYAWGSMVAPMLLTHTVSSFLEPAGMTAKLARGAGVDPAFIEPVVADLRTRSPHRRKGSKAKDGR